MSASGAAWAQSLRARFGFTIVELLIVIGLLVLLAAISYPVVTTTIERQRYEASLQAARHAALEARTDAMRLGETVLLVVEPLEAEGAVGVGLGGAPAGIDQAMGAFGTGGGFGGAMDGEAPASMSGGTFAVRRFDALNDDTGFGGFPMGSDAGGAAQTARPANPFTPEAPERLRRVGAVDRDVTLWLGEAGVRRARTAMSPDAGLLPLGALEASGAGAFAGPAGGESGGEGQFGSFGDTATDGVDVPGWFSEDDSGSWPLAVIAPSGEVVWSETLVIQSGRRGASVRYHPLSAEPIVRRLRPIDVDDAMGLDRPASPFGEGSDAGPGFEMPDLPPEFRGGNTGAPASGGGAR